MRPFLPFLFLAVAAPVGARETVQVQVVARVAMVATVERPSVTQLAAGETCSATVCVRANVPWQLTVRTEAGETVAAPVTGRPGAHPAVVVRLNRPAAATAPAVLTYTLTVL